MKYDRVEREHIEFENWKKIVIEWMERKHLPFLPLVYRYIDSLSHPFSNVHIKYDASNFYCLVNKMVMPKC